MIKYASKTGIILGILNIVSSLLIYIIDPDLFGSFLFIMLLGLINLILVVAFGVRFRKTLGEHCNFRRAYLFAVTAIAIMIGMRTGFNIVLFSVIDPRLKETVLEASIENVVSIMMGLGSDEGAIDQMIDEVATNMEGYFSPLGMFKRAVFDLLKNVVVASILALMIKKKKTGFED